MAGPRHTAARAADKPKDDDLDIELLSASQYDTGAGAAILPHGRGSTVTGPGGGGVTTPVGVLAKGTLHPDGLYKANLDGPCAHAVVQIIFRK